MMNPIIIIFMVESFPLTFVRRVGWESEFLGGCRF